MRHALLLSLPLWVGALAAPALAADAAADADVNKAPARDSATRLGAVTVSATKIETDIADVPSTVSVIDDQQIEENLVTDIKDLIRFEPGVSVRSAPSRYSAAGSATGRDGNSGFNIRGLEGNRILIQVDGIRLPEAFSFGAQATGRGDYLDLDLLKSVEILRGPTSALYGSDGVAGAVSFTTKDPDDYIDTDGWYAEAKAGYASADESLAKSALVAGRSGAWQYLLAYTRRDGHEQDTKGDNDEPNSNRTRANPQDIGSNAVLAKLVFAPSDAHRLRLTAEHSDREIDTDVLSAVAPTPTAATSTLALWSRDNIKRDRVSLDHRYTGDGGLLHAARWNLHWQQSRNKEYAEEDRNTAADRIRDNRFDTRVIGANADLETVIEGEAISHHFVYGGDLSITRQKSLRDGTVPPAGETFPARAFPTTDHTLGGLFVQDEISLMDKRLTLFPALRLDYYRIKPETDATYTGSPPTRQSDTHLSPKLGLVFKATDSIGLFANYARGFKAPSPSQVNSGYTNPVSNYQIVSNADLKPETSETIEAGVRLSGKAWSLNATAFKGWYKDFISMQLVSGSYTATNPAIFQYINLNRVEISGVEARGQLTLPAGFGLLATASYTKGDTRMDGDDVPLDTIDPFKLVAGLSWRAADDRFGGQLIATMVADKKSSRISTACSGGCFAPDGFTLVDATAFFNVNSHLSARVGVFNILDRKYWWWSDVRGLGATSTVKDAYTQPGRNVGLSLTARL
ncbi:TonB-dependent hemoglobin/transferrin/lactoferrin family receptor [Parapedomonas caeni]